jgi:hypothetical protein
MSETKEAKHVSERDLFRLAQFSRLGAQALQEGHTDVTTIHATPDQSCCKATAMKVFQLIGGKEQPVDAKAQGYACDERTGVFMDFQFTVPTPKRVPSRPQLFLGQIGPSLAAIIKFSIVSKDGFNLVGRIRANVGYRYRFAHKAKTIRKR